MIPLPGRGLVATLLMEMVFTTNLLPAEESGSGSAVEAPPVRESIESLDVLRDERVRLEQNFVLRVTSASIRRGPGGLVLGNGIEV